MPHARLCLIGLLLLCGCASESQSTAELAATFGQGVEAYDAHDYAKAYKVWSSIVDRDVAAMRNVAMMLRTGQGVAKDPKAAEDLYERAAEVGLPTAQADLADMLIKGEAGPPDAARALPLLRAAAAANHPVAQFELGRFYETGTLVPLDLTIARRLYEASAAHGDKDAAARLVALGPAPAAVPAPNSPPQAAPTAKISAAALPEPPGAPGSGPAAPPLRQTPP